MVTFDLNNLPFRASIDDKFYDELCENVEEVSFEESEIVTKQFSIGQKFYLLIEGKVSFSIQIEEEHEELTVSESDHAFTPVGWSGFREPYRYATTVVCNTNCKLLSWDHKFLRKLIDENPISGRCFLQHIVYQSMEMLEETKESLARSSKEIPNNFLSLPTEEAISKGVSLIGVDILRRSPFFEIYKESELFSFSDLGKVKHYSRGEKIFLQGEKATGLDVLIEGRVAHIYESQETEESIDLRIIQNSGYIIGSGCFSSTKNCGVTCVALKNSSVLHIDSEELEAFLKLNPVTGIRFYLRMLWFISNRLRSARAKFISIKHDGEIKAVRNLIEQNCTQLSVVSNLHKIPYLLKNSSTIDLALSSLHNLKANGTTLEKGLSNSCLDILGETVKEHRFYSGLANLYHQVVNSSKDWTPLQVRKYCAEQFLKVFANTEYRIKGEENLPDEASVFIYNHLKNHPFNTLPNNFQLTLDSHFISSVILYKKYNNPGIRVVRVPMGDEYGHQNYYERLGHIPVYTKDSDAIEETREEKQKRREEFYQIAGEYLKDGTSIILAPEGESFTTSNSPGMFKPGAFWLAYSLENEPLIVPIAIANFDKRLNHTVFSIVIKKPFKISERIEDPKDKDQIRKFLADYQVEYKSYVQEAIDLSMETLHTKIIETIA